MTEEMKAIFEKKDEELTDEDRETAKKAIDLFVKEVDEVCTKHGLAYQAILSVTQGGVMPKLNIVGLVAKDNK